MSCSTCSTPCSPTAVRRRPSASSPAFDNAVLGYADRSRIIGAEHRGLSVAGARFVLVDGFVAATWTSSDREDGGVEVTVRSLRPLDPAERADVEAEAASLAAFLGDGTPGSLTVTDL